MADKNVYGLPSRLGATPPGGGDDVDTRVTRLEARLDTMLPQLATKGDVSEAKADIIKWVAGVVFAAVAILISVLAFMLNRAVPPQTQAQAAPIVIYPVPQAGLPTAAPAETKPDKHR